MTPRDRILGAAYGVALGDILGATLEFKSRAAIRREFPDGHRDIRGGGPWHWRPGQVTDDTDMTLCVARGIRDAGLDAPVPALRDAVGRRFLAWADSGPPDIGITIAGGLAGALYGLSALPERWLAALEREPHEAIAALFR